MPAKIATSILLALLILCITEQMQAQDKSTWPGTTHDYESMHVDIVTSASPTTRQRCNHPRLTPTGITCKLRHHKSITYSPTEILAIIGPPTYDELQDLLTGFVFFGGLLAASFFVPLAAALALRIFVGIMTVPGCFYAAAALFSPSTYHDYDTLLYQRANTTLSVPLKLAQ